MGQKLNHQTAGFGPWFHLHGFQFGCQCLTHGHSVQDALEETPSPPELHQATLGFSVRDVT